MQEMGNIRQFEYRFFFICLAVFLLGLAGCTAHSPATGQNSPGMLPSGSTTTLSKPAMTSANPSTSPTLSQAEQIIQKAVQGITGVAGYSLRTLITNTETTRSDNADLATMEVISQMVIDTANHAMQMDNSYNIQNSGDAVNQSMMYVVDNELYIQGVIINQPEIWSKTAAPANYVDTLDQTRKLVDLLLSSKATVLDPRSYKIGGVDTPCDGLQIDPNLTKLWAILTALPGIQLPASQPPVAFDHFIQQTQVQVWLAQNSGLPVNAQLDASLRFDPSEWPKLTDRILIDLSIRMSFSDYNAQPVIVLPDEAKNATELNLQPATATP